MRMAAELGSLEGGGGFEGGGEGLNQFREMRREPPVESERGHNIR